MIRVVAGVPGSGKSYFMVNFAKKFFTYDSFYQEFSIKENYLIVSNIDGLKIPHLKLDSPEVIGNPDEGIPGKFTREQFFTVPNFEKLMSIKKVSNVILLIDEAQKDWLFPIGYKDPDVLFFFQYHRHIGVDILLGTQNVSQIARGILVLSEFVVQATPRSKSIIGNFSYKFNDLKGKFLYSKVLKKDKEVFRAYKSMSVDEIEKPKNVIKHWAIIAIAFFVVGGLCFKSALAALKAKSDKSASVAASTKLNADKGSSPSGASNLPPGAKLTHGQFSSVRSVSPGPSVSTAPVYPVVPGATYPGPSPGASVQASAVQGISSASASALNLPSVPGGNTAPPAEDEITVIGVYRADNNLHYLLSNSETLTTRKKLSVGDVVKFKKRVVTI